MISRLRRKTDPNSSGDADQNPADPVLRLEMKIAASQHALMDAISGLEKLVARISGEQHRANALNEDALHEAEEAVDVARSALERLGANNERSWKLRPPAASSASSVPAPTASDTRLLEALMPILDGIEAGLDSGYTQLAVVRDEGARRILRGWLDGQRLLRQRLLTLFEKESIKPIAAVGQPFDPYRHVVVETVYDPNRPTGTIVEERRRGYELNQRVLRFADVVVTKDREDTSFL